MEHFELLYNFIYFGFAVLFILTSLAIDSNKAVSKKIVNVITSLFLIATILIIGTRDIEVGTDTIGYYTYKWQMEIYAVDSEIFMDLIVRLVKYIEGSFTGVLLIFSLLFYLIFYKSIVKHSKLYNVYPFFIFFAFVSLFFSKSMGINVMRQGVSFAFLVFAYSMWVSEKKFLKVFPFLLLSFISHTTVLVPILIFIGIELINKKINLKYYYLLFFLGIVLAALNFGLLTFAPFLESALADSRRTSYLTDQSDLYNVGFKPQFVIFNTTFLLIAVFIKHQLDKLKSNMFDTYVKLLKYFIVSSFIFFMAFQIPYSDRWGLFSWAFIPFLVTPIFSSSVKPRLKTPIVLFFIIIFIFFQFYAKSK